MAEMQMVLEEMRKMSTTMQTMATSISDLTAETQALELEVLRQRQAIAQAESRDERAEVIAQSGAATFTPTTGPSSSGGGLEPDPIAHEIIACWIQRSH